MSGCVTCLVDTDPEYRVLLGDPLKLLERSVSIDGKVRPRASSAIQGLLTGALHRFARREAAHPHRARIALPSTTGTTYRPARPAFAPASGYPATRPSCARAPQPFSRERVG
jgi:hypothetical protein